MNLQRTETPRKAWYVKTKWGYKAQIVRKDGSTMRATKCHPTKEEAIASAQLWLEAIDAKNAKFQERQAPIRIG